jgi:thioredoxin-related protein
MFLLFCSFLPSPDGWMSDFDDARVLATKHQKPILLNFSGSDWCLPCIRLRKDVFETEEFKAYASENLVLVNADFPRQKKNKLPAESVQKNERLAERYNPDGQFPLTILLSADGKILKQWVGEQPGPSAFVNAIKNACPPAK